MKRKWRMPRLAQLPPPAMLAILYGTLILIGTVLLVLPVSTTRSIGWMTAFFTSTSAVTVTGLAVVDTGSTFTYFGQAVIALLIQLGGLGLMTFAMLLLSLLNIPIGMPSRLMVREDLNQRSLSNLTYLTALILKIALLSEALGAALLAIVFVPDFGWAEGLWQSVFHSVSAFNNAGFGLHHNSLTRWVDDPIVNTVIPVLFITSGMGFIVIADIRQKRRLGWFSLHTRLMLVGTAALILLGSGRVRAAGVDQPAYAWQYRRSGGQADGKLVPGCDAKDGRVQLGRHEPYPRRHRADDHHADADRWRQHIDGGRDQGHDLSRAASGDACLLPPVGEPARLRALAWIRGDHEGAGADDDQYAGGDDLAVPADPVQDGDFLKLAFEIASAFGTVGLSMGVTGELGPAAQVIIIFVMFLGRVGPLTLGFFLAYRHTPLVRYPEGRDLSRLSARSVKLGRPPLEGAHDALHRLVEEHRGRGLQDAVAKLEVDVERHVAAALGVRETPGRDHVAERPVQILGVDPFRSRATA